MNEKEKIQKVKNPPHSIGFQANRMTLFTLAALTILAIGISIYCLSSGYFIIFQNLFYIPIIIACVYYTKRGFVFSIIIACIYFFLTLGFTRESSTLLQAFIRVLIFIVVAGVITNLSLARKRVEEALQQQHDHLEDLVHERTAQLEKEITERKQREERITHLSNVLMALRNVNQLITHEKDRERLIQRSCDLLVERRSYEKSWILLLDENRNPVSVANAGFGEEVSIFMEQLKTGNYTECLKELLSQEERFLVYDRPGIRHKNCVLAGTHSTQGVFRCKLEYEGKLYGVLGVAISSTAVSDEEEQGLFLELAGDISFALANIEGEEEHKRVEGALKASEIRYRRLFEVARDGILILNAETGEIIDVNPFLIEMLGFSHDEFLGKKIWELRLLKDVIANKKTFAELQRKGYVHYEGLPLKTAAGRRLEVEFVSNVYEVDHYKVVQCNIRDITERRRAEEAQERLSRQLQAKVSELETFSYGIAHDLRSPLVSIESFSRLLREDLHNQKVDNVREDIRLLESSVGKMQDFLNKTLAYSRAEQLIKRTSDVSFGKIVNEVMAEFNEQISSIGATVSLADKFPRVYADRIRIAEVLTNLVQNSIKYRDKTVPLKIEIGHYPSENETIFFVRDNGLGIDASEAEKIFTLFYRGTADGEGSGIGLAIVKKIIEAHGGRIWVQQGQSGKGTTMCFTLPQQSGTNKGDNNGKD